MLLNITTIFVALIAIYLVYDMVELIKARQFSLARSRTYAVLFDVRTDDLRLFRCPTGGGGKHDPQPGAFCDLYHRVGGRLYAHRPDRAVCAVLHPLACGNVCAGVGTDEKAGRHEIRTSQTDLFRIHGRSVDFLHLDEEIAGLIR